MIRFTISSVFAAALLVGCGTPKNTPQSVSPKAVGGVIVSESTAAAEACKRAVLRNGANLLYENSRGLLLTDRALSKAELGDCDGLVAANETLALPADVRAQKRSTQATLTELIRLLNKSDIRADDFINRFPGADGRRVKVAVLDTGVDLSHPMLRVTPNKEPKMVAAHDFSGQGDVELQDVTLAEAKFEGTDGKNYQFGINATELKFGIFKGSTLIYSKDVSSQDKFEDIPVVTYLNIDGLRRGRMDMNGDGDFGNDKELYDFEGSRKLIQLGKNRSLSASFNINEDGSRATVVFDDGSHGTHVAGIAAGYDPNGLVGIAPGAQVISAKIGDNRLAGGSTTTASMVLAIDYAVSKGADVINMSYGIRAGSNEGASAIDKYVDKVALEEDVIFSISAGNEGPGMLTVGTPAAGTRAITNAAYLSVDTAKANYGYANFEKDNVWYFSSMGPLLDGGFKPTLTSPGTALSAVPTFVGGHATYSGTSMASPQTTGGLALLLSRARQQKLPDDRISITRAVYRGAQFINGLHRVQQGHGLMDVVASINSLARHKKDPIVEYGVRVVGGTTNGVGQGIFYRGTEAPANMIQVQVTPFFPKGTSKADQQKIQTFRVTHSNLVTSPGSFYLTGAPRSFYVDVSDSAFATPGIKSTTIVLTNTEEKDFSLRIPVTIVVPETSEQMARGQVDVEVGDVKRLFFRVPPGVSSVQVDLDSDGPMIWGQLLDSEGRSVVELFDGDRLSPQVPLRAEANLNRAGIFELDIVAPAYNKRTAKVNYTLKYNRLKFRRGVASEPGTFAVDIENYGESLRLKAKATVTKDQKSEWVTVTGKDRIEIPFTVTPELKSQYSGATFQVQTSKAVYDLMTDFPYYVLGPKDELVTSGGLQLDSSFSVSELKEGDYKIIIQGAFTQAAPEVWGFRMTQSWKRTQEAVVAPAGRAQIVRHGAWMTLDVSGQPPTTNSFGLVRCLTVTALDALNRSMGSVDYCD